MAEESDPRKEAENAISRSVESAKQEMEVFELDAVTYARRRLKDSLVSAVITMTELAEWEDLDIPIELLKLRYNASKYLLDRAFGSVSPTSGEHSEKESDPLDAFLEAIVEYPVDK